MLSDKPSPGGLALTNHTPVRINTDNGTANQLSPLSNSLETTSEMLEPMLSAAWVRKAAEELHENPKTLKRDVETLRNMVLAESNWHVRTDDAFLLRFLRARKFNCGKAFHMMQRYYAMKLRCPELFKVPRASDKMDVLELQAQVMLEDRDANGSRIFIFRVEKVDSSSVSIEDVFRTNILALEHAVQEPETQIAGLTAILDMSGFGFPHAKFLSPYYARRTVEVIQETFPLRFKGFHVVHQPFYFDAVFAVLKPFLKEKIRKRIYMHGKDMASLHACISADILPREYGGTKGSFDNAKWREALLADEDHFAAMEKYGYNQDKILTPESEDPNIEDIC